MKKLQCDGRKDCTNEIACIDEKGFIYCLDHRIPRGYYTRKCRKLRPYELNRLKKGLKLKKY